MNERTVTITVPVEALEVLMALARLVHAEVVADTKRLTTDGKATQIVPPAKVSIPVSQNAEWVLSRAVGAVKTAQEYTALAEERLTRLIEERVPIPGNSACSLRVYTQAKMVACFSGHGSFGPDGELRHLDETAKEKMQFVRVLPDQGYTHYDGRPYEITHRIVCG